MFIVYIITLLTLIQAYIIYKSFRFVSRFFDDSKTKKILRLSLILIFGYLNLSFVLSLTLSRTLDPMSSDLFTYWILYPGGVWQGTSIIIFIIFLLKDIIISFYSFISFLLKKLSLLKNKEAVVSESRRKFLKGISASLALPPLLSSIYGVAMQSFNFDINKKRIKFNSIPDELKGLKIVQLSDIHAGIYLKKKNIMEAVEITNNLEPDLVVLTGDFVSNSEKYIYMCIESLSFLKPRLGIYSCIGNHDNWVNRSLVIEGLKSAGMNIMIEENQKLEYNGCEFYIAGTEDMWYEHKKPDLNKALKNIPQDSFKILLSHQPELFDEAEMRNVNLTLSGHYHGGQIAVSLFGMNLSLGTFATSYISGLFMKNNSYLYVNNGIGFTGPPFRMNVPPEITMITLV